MDFLLECIGFPPDVDVDALAARIRAEGEPVAYRGPGGEHLKLRLPGRIELRLDREADDLVTQVFPYYDVPRRLRVRVARVERLLDSPFDALLVGSANPPLPDEEAADRRPESEYALATYLTDARRLPGHVSQGHVLAVSVAGFALDVESSAPDERAPDERAPDERAPDARAQHDPEAAFIAPLTDPSAPSGTVALSLVVERVRRVTNPWSGEEFLALEVAAPERALDLFVSRWQLAADGLDEPQVGWRIAGTFLFTGRVSGGLPPLANKRFG
ncbi:MAG: hypothetical protein WD226_04350 [Planctomycetota bacterium]